jgi:predicted permease
MGVSFVAIAPIFILIAVGYALKRLFVKNEYFWENMEKLVYYLFFPMLLILEITDADFNVSGIKEAVFVTIGSTIIVAFIMFAAQRVINFKKELFSSVFQGGIRYNSYIFLALSYSLFGGKGAAISGIFVAYMIVVTNILSVGVLNYYGSKSQKSFKGILLSFIKNPLILSVLAALMLNFFDIRFTGWIRQTMSYLGAAATPLSLMAVGAGLIFLMAKDKNYAVAYSVALKLVLMPIVAALLIKSLGLVGVVADVALLYAGISCAGNAYILSRQMGGDSEAMASIITWSTIASAVSIPLVFEFLASRL